MQPQQSSLIQLALDGVVARFELAWQTGLPPRIVDFLDDGIVQRQKLLVELIHTDMAHRFKDGQTVTAQDYLTQFPELAASPDDVIELIVAEVSHCRYLGGTPVLEDVLRRYPLYREELAIRLATPPENKEIWSTRRRPNRGTPAGNDGGRQWLGRSDPDFASPDALPELAEQTKITAALPEGANAAPMPQVPGYELLSVLGRGGMGVVYKARQIRLKRLVALKMILHGAYADQEQRQRFRREAEAIARLRHPNIVQIYEVGDFEGLPYFALEYCGGGTLSTKLQSGPVAPEQAARVIELLARAVDVAHQNLVIHRDLKPTNVLIGDRPSPAGNRPEPEKQLEIDGALAGSHWPEALKITDFGLARTLGGDAAATLPGNLTDTGDVMGTPGYMAPEQARGDRVGPPADIYSLGAILYEMLTGRTPFGGSMFVFAVRVQSTEPESPRSVKKSIPADLNTICLKCLEKEPAARYASAEALAEDLRRFQAGEPILARPVGHLERAVKWARRHPARAIILAMGLGLTALAVVGAAMTWLWLDSDAARQEADIARKDAEIAWKKEQDAHQVAQQALDRALRAEKGLQRYLYGESVLLAAKEWHAGNLLRARELLAECQEKHRNFEWYYLKQLIAPEIATLAGRQGFVSHVAFSPDNVRLASAGEDGTVKLWDAYTGQEAATLAGHKDIVNRVTFSPDSQRLASASEDGTVKLWNAKTLQEIATLTGHKAPVRHVAFSPDGKRLASAGDDHVVRLWDAQTGHATKALAGHAGRVWHVTYNRDGQHLASASEDRTVKLWDAQTGKEIATLAGHKSRVFYVTYSPDSQRLASASEDGTVKLWDARTGKETATLASHKEAVMHLAFSPDGKRLASASLDKTVKLWDVETAKEVETRMHHEKVVNHVRYSPDGQQLVSASNDKTVKVWDARTGTEIATLAGHSDRVNHVAYSPDGQRLASAGKDGTVKLWDAHVGKQVITLAGHKDLVRYVAYRPDGLHLASASKDGTVKLWDTRTGKEIQTLAGHKGGVNHVTYSPDGQRLASAGQDDARLWDAQTGKQIAVLAGQTGPVRHVAFSPDSLRLASAGFDKTVKLWNAATGAEIAALTGHKAVVNHLKFSPDGRQLASASFDATVKLWDVATGKEIFTLSGHEKAVRQVAYSSNGQQLASASEDGSVKLWDTQTGKEIAAFKGHTGIVNQVAFGPKDSHRLASASADGTVRVWDLRFFKEIAMLTGHNRNVDLVIYSPDGERLASAGEDGSVKLWDARTGREVATLVGHARGFLTAAFRPDGQQLASASEDGTIKLWSGHHEN